MIVRKLDDSHDWTFGKGKENYSYDEPAIAQNIQTRLLSWFNDCFFGMQDGVDWSAYFEKGQANNMVQAIKSEILSSYGVIAVNSVEASLDASRKITISYNIDTIFSQAFTAIINQG